MRLLLDTAPFLWIAANAPELPPSARGLFSDPDNELYLSAVSAWEIALKFSLGKLELDELPQSFVPAMREAHGIEPLPLREEAALQIDRLPALHRDPFDRMLVCQAIVHGLQILTPDEAIRAYPVRTIW